MTRPHHLQQLGSLVPTSLLPKPEEGGDKEEVKLEGPVSARHCSCAELLLPKLTSRIPPGTLLHGTDSRSSPQAWEQAESKATF